MTTQTSKTASTVLMVCRTCGSTDVRRSADAAWSVANQQWELITVHEDESAMCNECAADCEINEVQAPTGAPSTVDAARRLLDAMGGNPPDWIRVEALALEEALKRHHLASTTPDPQAALEGRRLSELTPTERDAAQELWLRNQVASFESGGRNHVAFLLDRLDQARAHLHARLSRSQQEAIEDVMASAVTYGTLSHIAGRAGQQEESADARQVRRDLKGLVTRLVLEGLRPIV